MDLVLGAAPAVAAAASAAEAASSATTATAARDAAVLARDQTQGIASQVDGLPATLLANAAGVLDLDANQYQAWRLTLTGDVSQIRLINRPIDRAWQGMLYLQQDSTGGRGVTFPEDWVFSGGLPIMPAARRSWMAVQLRAVEGAVFALIVGSGPVVQVFDFTAAALPAGATLTRASTGTHFDAGGVMRTAAVDAPRFDNRWTGAAWEKAGLLVEPQRTNAVQRSADSSNWGNDGLILTANAGLAPNGLMEADKAAATNVNGGHRHRGLANLTAGVVQTLSAFAQPQETRQAYIELSSNWGGPSLDYDLDTGQLLRDSGFVARGFERAGAAWSRLWGAKVPAGTGLGDTRGPGLRVPAGTVFVGDNVGGLLFWGHQIEDGDFPTSLIPTTGAAATRARDLLKIALADGLYDFEAETPNGTFFASDVQVTGGQGWTFDWAVFGGGARETQLKKLKVVASQTRFDFTGGALPVGVIFTRASTGTYFDAMGLLKTGAVDAPRFDYRWNGAAWQLGGLLVEPQRTNVVPQSIDLSAAAGWINGNLAVGGKPDPTGGNAGWAINDTDPANGIKINRFLANILGGQLLPWALSVLARETPGAKSDRIIMSAQRATTGFWWGGVFIPTLGWGGNTNGGVVARRFVERRGPEWWWLSTSSDNDNAGDQTLYVDVTNADLGSQQGETTFYGIQVEQGPFPTSPIPTTGAAATRAADLLKLPLADGTYTIAVDTPDGAFVAKGVQVAGGQGWAFDWAAFPQALARGIRHIKRVRTY